MLIRARAAALGFEAVGVTRAALDARARAGLAAFLDAGAQGEMGWMASRAEQRADPRALWPEAVSVIALGLSYAPDEDPLATLAHPDRGNLSVYARNRDYHDLLKGRAKHLAQFIASRFGAGVKVFVDTAPVMEKPLAAAAGLGWQGKHTNLVSRRHGSWLFLAEIYTTLALPPDPPHPDRCGSCSRCLAACPTDAFPAPYRLDARRCISYLTIELKGSIPLELRPLIGNRIYGCDDCQLACPWNRFAQTAALPDFEVRNGLDSAWLVELFAWGEADFNERLAGSPIRRIGHERWLRNIAVALGNAPASPEIKAALAARLDHPSGLVREHVTWALTRREIL